ncbi:MAG: G/U mismatch-specific DNA glycosylase [Gemmataceae bacterium]
MVMARSKRARQARPTRQELVSARHRTLPDVIAPGLKVLLCGINPSLYSAAMGQHFARPGNRFWPALYRAGITERQLAPKEQRELLSIGYGVSNIVARATAQAAELDDGELQAGIVVLERKVRRFRPGLVAFLGVTAYRAAFGKPRATLGLQQERLAEAPLWVLPNPSGLNAHHQLDDLARLMRQLHQHVSGDSQ